MLDIPALSRLASQAPQRLKSVNLFLREPLAVRELRISGADVPRRMNIDRSSVSRPLERVQADPALKDMSNALLDQLQPEG